MQVNTEGSKQVHSRKSGLIVKIVLGVIILSTILALYLTVKLIIAGYTFR